MVATPEAKVKKVVVRQLKALGAYYFSPVTGGFGRSGVPDIVGCFRGHFFAIECKEFTVEWKHIDVNMNSVTDTLLSAVRGV